MKTNPLVALGRAGQSPWLDYIHRGMIASGELARRVAEDGIKGVTSNPTIFEKAVTTGHDYDAQVAALAKERAPLLEAYKRIVTDDIRAAADVLRTVYDATKGDDAYVSLEVDPDLARDTKATIARARELFDAVGRPNVMIKIPGTKEGLPAAIRARWRPSRRSSFPGSTPPWTRSCCPPSSGGPARRRRRPRCR
jgi:transaldolase